MLSIYEIAHLYDYLKGMQKKKSQIIKLKSMRIEIILN